MPPVEAYCHLVDIFTIKAKINSIKISSTISYSVKVLGNSLQILTSNKFLNAIKFVKIPTC